jgi:enoyl-CoA hydratase/carnithine racemase
MTIVDQQVLFTNENGIGIITFNRPEKLNATTAAMNARLGQICEEVKQDDSVRAVVITGAGRAFCAGTDVSPERTGEAPPAENRTVSRFRGRRSTLDRTTIWSLLQVPKPTICAINGAAVGLGAEFTLQCDVRIASDAARWGQVFVMRGWVPDTGAGTYLLSRIVGLSKALELVCSGEIIDAQEMLRIGLVTSVVPVDWLRGAAIAMATKMSRGAPLAIRAAKELIYRGLERNMEEHSIANSSAFGMLTNTEDHAEGVRSFLEKREPRWKGR